MRQDFKLSTWFSHTYVFYGYEAMCVTAQKIRINIQNEAKNSIVWSCCPNKFLMMITASGFRSVKLCSNLMMMHAKRGYNTLSQGITTVKTSIEYKKSASAIKFATKYKRSGVSNVVITETI